MVPSLEVNVAVTLVVEDGVVHVGDSVDQVKDFMRDLSLRERNRLEPLLRLDSLDQLADRLLSWIT